VVAVAAAAALLVRHGGFPTVHEQAAPAAAPGTPAGAGEAPARKDLPAPTAAIPFSPRIYPATPLPAAPALAPGAPHGSLPHAPGSGTPASISFDRLKAAADAGDRDAACRVGLELVRCTAAPGVVSATTRGADLAHSECSGVSPSDMQSASRYLAQASAAGSDAARRALAGDASVSPTDCGR